MNNIIISNIISGVSTQIIVAIIVAIASYFLTLYTPFQDEIKIRYKIYKLNKQERKQLGTVYFLMYFDISNLIQFNLKDDGSNRIKNTKKYTNLIELNQEQIDLNFSNESLLKLERLDIFFKNIGFGSVQNEIEFKNKIRYGVINDYMTSDVKKIIKTYSNKLYIFSLDSMIKLEIAERCFKKMQLNFNIENL